ncbi:MAG: TIGR04283 family arsenosugar biosynthesis glycosyltransferase [Mariprofundaceae bacterium]|nr:TIGR04283 family arsenosugar biosynthesis glycosyltransferase [Mariprofundaceae bacterium]
MSEAPLTIAVVVPVLNEAEALPDLQGSLRACRADKLVFVDGGSDDGSLDILRASGVCYTSSKPGRAAQMNAGAKVCKSDILLFLHADTFITSSHIENVRQFMQASSVVGGRFDLRLSGKHSGLRVIEWFINQRSRLSGISTGDQAQFVRRDVFEAMGGFSDIPLMEDVDFSRRLKRQGKQACLRQTVLSSSRRWEQHGLVRTVLLMWRMRLLYWLGVDAARLAGMYRQAR